MSAGRAVARALGAAGWAALMGCATLPPPGAPLAGGVSRSEAVVVLRAHAHVLAVSASARHVYALTTGGLVIWDRVSARWLEPSDWLTAELRQAGVGDAFAPVGQVVLAADPVEEAVWIGVPGAVVVVRPRVSQAQRITVAGIPDLIAFARDGGEAWVRATGRWSRVSRAGFVSTAAAPPAASAVVVPADLEAVYRAHPALRAQLPFLLRDEGAGAVAARVRAGTLSPDRPGEAWIGTWGDGLWAVDARFLSARALPGGLPGDDVRAVWLAEDGVWVAAHGPDGLLRVARVHDGSGAERDVARPAGSAPDLTEREPGQVLRAARDSVVVVARGTAVRWVGPDGEERPVTLPGASRAEVGPLVAVALDADRVWIAGQRGVFHVPRDAAFGTAPPVLSRGLVVGRELPAEVQALAVAPPYAWVGTRAGLVRVRLTGTGDIP